MVEKATSSEAVSPDGDGNFSRYMWIGVGSVLGVLGLIFIGGVVLAVFADPQKTALRVGMIRDTLIIIMFLESTIIVLGVAVLVLQTARLVNTLRNGAHPILENTQETAQIVRGTAQFVGKNAVRPVISVYAFFSTLFAFMREIGGIRRAIRRTPSETPETK